MTGENNWLATETGQSLIVQSTLQAMPWVWPLCGHNALVLQPEMAGNIKPQLQCTPSFYLQYSLQNFIGHFICAESRLPLVNECMALVYAQFVLELTSNRVQLIAEIDRILVAEGYLAMLCLNPYSLYGITGKWRKLQIERNDYWSALLLNAGFEICRSETIGPYWPRNSISSSDKIIHRPGLFRSVNFILARKRKSALTPLRKNANAVALAREKMT
jgi:SAM-dependent methyltransferase